MNRETVRVLGVIAVVAILVAAFIRMSRGGVTPEADQPLVSFA